MLHIRWPFDRDKTLSQNAARHRIAIVYYGIILFIFLTLFTVFVVGWFIPTSNLPMTFTWIVLIGLAGQYVAVFVPETGGIKSTIHVAASAFMSFSCYVVVALLTFVFYINFPSHLAAGIALVAMTICLLTLLLYKRVLQYALFLQIIYLLSFFFTIGVATLTV